eukprot:scaffold36275_cov154-Isochrysis_galbana.AAC.32
MAAVRRPSVRAMDASEPLAASPSTASPGFRCAKVLLNATTCAAQSLPGGPGSPGYEPSTFRTSRKLRPTARTCNSTCGRLMAGSSPWATMRRLLIAPRASKCRRIGPVVDKGASVRRGTRRTPAPTATSISTASPTSPLRAASEKVSPADMRVADTTSRHARADVGCSDRTVRARPRMPEWPGAAAAPRLDA